MQYKIGDIIFASKGTKIQDEDEIKSHLFVIIDDDGNVVPADYFGFVVSSRLEKSKTNSRFKFNEPILKNESNNLKVNSIVKCDQLLSIPSKNINKKIGTVSDEEMTRFLNSFQDYITENT